MKAKTKIAERFTLKAKFRSTSEIELTCTDLVTGAVYVLIWTFETDEIMKQRYGVEPDVVDESHDEDASEEIASQEDDE